MASPSPSPSSAAALHPFSTCMMPPGPHSHPLVDISTTSEFSRSLPNLALHNASLWDCCANVVHLVINRLNVLLLMFLGFRLGHPDTTITINTLPVIFPVSAVIMAINFTCNRLAVHNFPIFHRIGK